MTPSAPYEKSKSLGSGDALELSNEEGRGKLRKAMGRSTHPEIRGWPNGVTRLLERAVILV